MNDVGNPGANQTAPVFSIPWRLKDGRSCILRNMREDDAEAFVQIIPQTVEESDFLSYLPGEFAMTVEQERAFIRDHLCKPRAWTAVAEMDGTIIAYAGAASQDRKRYAHHAEFGLAVVKAVWGQGLGRKLTEMAVHWGRDAGLHKLYLRVFDNNTHAIRLYESLGFREEAHLKDDYLRGDGTYGDTIVMSVFYVH